MNSDTDEVLEGTFALIQRARQSAPTYAAGVIGCSTRQLAKLYEETNTELHDVRYEVATAMVLPFRGGHIIGRESCAKRSDHFFNNLHELGHVLAGEVGVFLTDEFTMSFSERRADLFAVADLTPTRWMDRHIRGQRFLYAAQSVKQVFRGFTEGWSEQRLWDRARLRVLLYRQHGI